MTGEVTQGHEDELLNELNTRCVIEAVNLRRSMAEQSCIQTRPFRLEHYRGDDPEVSYRGQVVRLMDVRDMEVWLRSGLAMPADLGEGPVEIDTVYVDDLSRIIRRFPKFAVLPLGDGPVRVGPTAAERETNLDEDDLTQLRAVIEDAYPAIPRGRRVFHDGGVG